MNLEIITINDVTVVRVKEEKLVFPILSRFFNKVSDLIEAGSKKLIVDLSEVSYIDSASIGCLMDIYRMMSERSGAVRLQPAPPAQRGASRSPSKWPPCRSPCPSRSPWSRPGFATAGAGPWASAPSAARRQPCSSGSASRRPLPALDRRGS